MRQLADTHPYVQAQSYRNLFNTYFVQPCVRLCDARIFFHISLLDYKSSKLIEKSNNFYSFIQAVYYSSVQ